LHISTDEELPASFLGLHQVVAFQPDIISGAKPIGIEGFDSLAKLEVKTIVCVDGVPPDFKTAEEFGMKTVHIPLKYEAPSPKQILDLATAVSRGRERGVVYIHCHQGKHRSAAAAAIVSVAFGDLTIPEAKEQMRVSQTSVVYQGLWDAVERTEMLNVDDVLQNNTVFPSSVEPKGITSQMIWIDDALDNLHRLQRSEWSAPSNHPDLVGAAEVGMIVDTFRLIQLSTEANRFSNDFETLLVNAMHQASSLEEALVQELPKNELNIYLKRVEQSCINCHATHRR
jgi:hypothetical protein